MRNWEGCLCMEIKVIPVSPCAHYVITLTPEGAGTIEAVGFGESKHSPFQAALDGLESLLLACACEGLPVDGPEFQRAVVTAIDAIENKFL